MRALLLTLAALGLTILTADLAQAGPRSRFRGRHLSPEAKQKLLDRFDRNGDGTLDEGERAAAREAFQARRAELRAELLRTYDQDGSGTLEGAERQAAREGVRAKARERVREQVKARVDTDGDGQVSEAEEEAAKTALRARLMQRFDRDGDGALSPAEKQAARRALMRTPRGRLLLRWHQRRRACGAGPVTPGD